jgi:hypothetical protein
MSVLQSGPDFAGLHGKSAGQSAIPAHETPKRKGLRK